MIDLAVPSDHGSLLYNFFKLPALILGERTRLLDKHTIAGTTLVLRVMHLIALLAADVLAVLRMNKLTGHRHDDGFLHLVADDFADAGLLTAPLRRSCLQLLVFFGHCSSPGRAPGTPGLKTIQPAGRPGALNSCVY